MADPRGSYAAVEFDALVLGSDGAGLVLVCLDRARTALAQALAMDRGGPGEVRRSARSRALCDAILALNALERGVDDAVAGGDPLLRFYRSAAAQVTAATTRFEGEAIAILANDLAEVRDSLVARPAIA